MLVPRQPYCRPRCQPCDRSCSRRPDRIAWPWAVIGGLAILGGLAVSHPPRLLARDIHVNNVTGDNRNEGISPLPGEGLNGPCRSLERALFLAHAGDRIVVANTGEPYRESITLQGGRHSGNAQRPFQIIGNGAVLDGRHIVPASAWEHWRGDIYRFQASSLSLGLLYLGDRPAYPRARAVLDSTVDQLRPGEGILWDRWYYVRVEAGRLPTTYEFSHTVLPVGITLYDVHNVVIQDLVIQGFRQDGVCAFDGATEVRLEGLRSRGNGRGGFAVGGSSRVTLEACLAGNNAHAQVWLEGFSTTQLDLCTLPDRSAPAILRAGGRLRQDGQSR